MSIYSILFTVHLFVVFFFVKQKTAYEMRISDWSSDVCSSDLTRRKSIVDVRNFPPGSVLTENAMHSQILDGTRGAGMQRQTKCGEIGRASCRERVCQYV